VLPTIAWDGETVVMIDQRRLPQQETYLHCRDHHEVAAAIRDMAIRGAPAIGVAAAMGLVLGMQRLAPQQGADRAAAFEAIASELAATRPTAVNLAWAIARMRRCLEAHLTMAAGPLISELLREALAIEREDLDACRRLGDTGASLLPERARVLTHCNAGALATAGYGTALGIVRSAARLGKIEAVFADETRPFLQGARLTVWELMRDGIPTTLITDNMAAHLMARGEVNAVVVGADRIAANGDVANKIGTYGLAVLAKEHAIPFLVAAPVSTFDPATPTGAGIPIEERSPDEVTCVAGQRIAPEGALARHPAFDITPARLVSAIVSERGVARPPFAESLAQWAGQSV
jgi:methylthioribose-1-phosphate isomerase